MPDRSSLPDGVLGAGADMSGLPSFIGMPSVGMLRQCCAAAGSDTIRTAATPAAIGFQLWKNGMLFMVLLFRDGLAGPAAVCAARIRDEGRMRTTQNR